MVKRMIVKIDEEKCTGCGKCVAPCAEGAIQIINGKAKVVSEQVCDGMGFCIGICPKSAIPSKKDTPSNLTEKKQKPSPSKKTTLSVVSPAEPAKIPITFSPSDTTKESIWIWTRDAFKPIPRLIVYIFAQAVLLSVAKRTSCS